MPTRLEDLARSFGRHLRAEGRSERTVTIYGQAVRFFSEWLATQGRPATLDELTRGGLSNTPPFALVEWEKTLGSTPSIVHAIIRGDVAITVHSAENTLAVDASGVSTWLEREFDAVTGIEVRAGAARSAGGWEHGLPLVSGVVVTDSVAIGSVAADT